jgi:6-phosphofructokinase 2
VLDTSGDALVRALEVGVHLVKPNLRELAGLAGRDIEDDRDLEDVARRLVEDGGAAVVAVSQGSGGLSLVDGDGCRHVKAPSVPVRSKVGAGDSAVGGLVLALARGDGLATAARWAVAAGAAAVMTPGTELCRRDDVERLVRLMESG